MSTNVPGLEPPGRLQPEPPVRGGHERHAPGLGSGHALAVIHLTLNLNLYIYRFVRSRATGAPRLRTRRHRHGEDAHAPPEPPADRHPDLPRPPGDRGGAVRPRPRVGARPGRPPGPAARRRLSPRPQARGGRPDRRGGHAAGSPSSRGALRSRCGPPGRCGGRVARRRSAGAADPRRGYSGRPAATSRPASRAGPSCCADASTAHSSAVRSPCARRSASSGCSNRSKPHCGTRNVRRAGAPTTSIDGPACSCRSGGSAHDPSRSSLRAHSPGRAPGVGGVEFDGAEYRAARSGGSLPTPTPARTSTSGRSRWSGG